MAGKKNVEAVFPLTPMQQGLLVHSLQAADGDPGLLHLRCDVTGPLDPDRFREAWVQGARRHPVLRTVLRWEALDEPLQIVLRDAAPILDVEDLAALRPVEQQKRIGAALADDRARGLDLTKAPTMRLRLFQTGPEAAHLVWTCHHVLLDGWSSALVLGDVVALYNAAHAGTPAALPPAPPFRDYVRWLGAQDDSASETFWRQYLAGRSAPTPLRFEALAREAETPGDPASGTVRQDAELTLLASQALRAVARRLGVTLGTVLQGAWAMLLSRTSGHEDVVFDVTNSGRAVDLLGVESIAGMLINALPIRVRLDPEARASDVFRRLHEAQAEWVRHAHSAPAQVHAWSDTPAHLRLCESLLVVENYPHATDGGGPLRFDGLDSGVTSGYPLTVIATPGDVLGLHLLYDSDRFSHPAMIRLLYRFERLLQEVADAPDRPVADLIPEAAAASMDPSAPPRSTERDVSGPYVAPRGEIEQRVVAIWEEVLGVKPVGMDDGFFDLGGQSVQVVQLLTRVEHAFGTKPSMSTLLGGGTPARMAAALGAEERVETSLLVPLALGGSRPPLFCVHSYDGGALLYHGLAQHLDADRPVYGIQAVGFDGDGEMLTDVREMAACYVEEVRAVQPRGPYALAALCFGVAVALEMGRLLIEAGEEVDHLFAFDTAFNKLIAAESLDPASRSERPASSRPARILKRLARPETLRELPVHLALHGQMALASLKQAVMRPLLARAGTHQLRQWEAFNANKKAWRAYRPQPYPGPVTFVRSSSWSGWDATWWHVPVWTELAKGGLTVHAVPGSHGTMMHEPYVQTLAGLVRACLDPAAEGALEAHAAATAL